MSFVSIPLVRVFSLSLGFSLVLLLFTLSVLYFLSYLFRSPLPSVVLPLFRCFASYLFRSFVLSSVRAVFISLVSSLVIELVRYFVRSLFLAFLR